MKYLLLIFIISCGTLIPEGKPKVDYTSILQTRYDSYVDRIDSFRDIDGFVDVGHCDSLLFSGLLGTALSVNLEAAEERDGRWLRRPVAYPECYENGKSRSTISRDGLMGVMHWAYSNKRVDVLERIWEYGEARDWFMGDGRLKGADTYFNVQYRGLLAHLLYALGGSEHPYYMALAGVGSPCETYTCHLQVLYLDLLGQAKGGLSQSQVDTLVTTSEKYPDNPYFKYMAAKYTNGDIAPVVDMLLSLYPASGPTQCEFWPIQQNGENYWRKCKGAAIKNVGADFLFLANKIMLDNK